MATNSPQAHKPLDEEIAESEATESFPASTPAPLSGKQLEPEDTWMTFGMGVEGAEDERTVTVVFSLDDESTAEFLSGPLSPVFPGRR
ncbi:MAG TPA: hypothetical protein VLW55_20390 [Burkholderiaceae bacterium]|nr:hypothetical protein [Burkholderiaceae bacterium]